MKHTVVFDKCPPNPNAPWFVTRADGAEWHTHTEDDAHAEATYRPGRAKVGEATPQSDPDLFTDAEIRAEVKHLLSLNHRLGTHPLRVEAYGKLLSELQARKGK